MIGDDSLIVETPAILAHLDSSGNLLKLQAYLEPGFDEQALFFDMIKTKDTGYAAVGFVAHPQMPWMVKLDASFCFTEDDCGEAIPVSHTPLIPESLNLAQLWPNPVQSGFFYLRLPESIAHSNSQMPPGNLRKQAVFNMMDPLASEPEWLHRDTVYALSETFFKSEKSTGTSLAFTFDSFLPLVTLIDMQGREYILPALQEREQWKCMLPEDIQAGIYIVRVFSGGSYWYDKLIVL